MADLVEAEGMTHMVSPIQSEFTLCGDAFDLASEEAGYQWTEAKRITVNCPSCAAVIRACQSVKTRVSANG